LADALDSPPSNAAPDTPGAPVIRDSPPPNAAPGAPVIRGSLSREIIQRVVRRHLNEARYCYESRLAQNPNLGGRVTVAFVIGPTGDVVSASAADDTMGDPEVAACLTTAARRWTFPPPEGGGVVAVSYPFVFQTE
jgi:TonB family protein